MNAVPTARLMPRAQVMFRRAFARLMTMAAEQAAAALALAAGADGVISPRESEDAIRRVGQIIRRTLMDDTGRSIDTDGTPRSPYALLLLAAIAWLTREVVTAHGRYMIDRLDSELLEWMRQAQPDIQPDGAGRNLLLPLAIAGYERAQAWVGPDGLTMVERIARVELETRTKAAALIRDEIKAGTAAVLIARKLAQWLVPGRAKMRTNKLYGIDGSTWAMRLATSEIVRAGNAASLAAADRNPFTLGIDIVRSPDGDPDCPICPQHETINIAGYRVREPYRRHNAPLPGFHPWCKCDARTVTGDGKPLIDALRERRRKQERAPLSPINEAAFTRELLGANVAALLPEIDRLFAPPS